ncbi:MAG: type II secretion system protein GspE [Lachnospiraceae bacterium]|nr:MAG: type II secretion system protein GspE [Lachnospiraceae bacterium]
MQKAKRLGDILVESKAITQEQLMSALQKQKTMDKKLGEILVLEGILKEEQILKVLEVQLRIPYVSLSNFSIDKHAANMISEQVAKKYNVIPLKVNRGRLLLAMSDPLDIFAIDDVKLLSGLEISVAISSSEEIKRAINKTYDSTKDAERAVEEFKEEMVDLNAIEGITEDADVANAPMVRLVNSIITQAVNMKASDIHIEPFDKIVRIRFRIDGDLKEIMSPSKVTHSAIVTRIKILGAMDIAERRIPQDGRVETSVDGKLVDLRISILPSVYGEKIVIRLLYRDSIMLTKEQLGFTPYNLELFHKIIQAPEGIILVTGPTGSGKSTTLYTVLRELNDIKKNIITVEDPVEYRLDGVTQVQVNQKAGLTFAAGLRSILRQDPDIVMIGEIRDNETVEIATRASITGHLVLSTLHTNDTASSISRLEDMGIEPFMVSTSVVGIIAQRLVKRICPKCKQEYISTPDEMSAMKLSKPIKLYKGKGCNNCNGTGFSGRIAIHEILVMDREIKSMVNRRVSIDEIKQRCIDKGMKTLNQTATELVLSGITSVSEMLKVTYSID